MLYEVITTTDGTGFSQKVENQDSNGDSLSESYYEINSENIDFMPIAPDTIPPEVTIISPKENKFFNENETVFINVSANDKSGIHSMMA